MLLGMSDWIINYNRNYVWVQETATDLYCVLLERYGVDGVLRKQASEVLCETGGCTRTSQWSGFLTR